MTDTNTGSASSRRRFLGAVGTSALLALGVDAQAMRIQTRLTEGLSPDEVRAFSRDFSVLVDGGMSLVATCDTLAARQNNPAFAAIIRQISDELAQGACLSREMARFPGVFDASYIVVIQNGEYHGTLEESLHQLAQRA